MYDVTITYNKINGVLITETINCEGFTFSNYGIVFIIINNNMLENKIYNYVNFKNLKVERIDINYE